MGYEFKMDFGFLDNLISDDQVLLEQAWGLFINNFLKAMPEVRREMRRQIVIKTESWQGHGMGQAYFSRMIYSWTGVRILAFWSGHFSLGKVLGSFLGRSMGCV